MPSKPSWWQYPYRAINRRDYHLGDLAVAGKSQVVVVESADFVIVIPCHEVFRTMYAPHSHIALALTSGPWDLTKTQVIAPEGTGKLADGRWGITLRRTIGDIYANHLANLCIPETGIAAANGIYTHLLKDEGAGYLNAPIPFNLYKLRLSARGLWLKGEPPKFLALNIVAMDWPDAPPLVIHRDNSGMKGETQTPIAKDKPYSKPGTPPPPDDNGLIDTNSQEDPIETAPLTTFTLPSVLWGNLPPWTRKPKDESFIYEGRPNGDTGPEVGSVSPGVSWSGDTDSGASAYSASSMRNRDVSQRFSEVIDMFEMLQRTGAIQSWSAIPHPRPHLHIDSLPLWHFPLRTKDSNRFIPFGYIERQERRARGALVCELQLGDETIYWLEIEVRHNEAGRKALVYTVAEEFFETATLKLLELAALNRGKWLPCDELIEFAGVSMAEPWKHSYIGRSRQRGGGRLNEGRALDTITRVCLPSVRDEHDPIRARSY
ncbi:hypothetical protein [Ectothiorhodospira sp. 9905]|uniref:hypothetical protein n=1 Tax=Ectothiorhodospira sp. 9905 TaxID=2897387 RepID=UPI001EE89303|nr:hypothetical protein [Ectothiorhodospira sp. 9905]